MKKLYFLLTAILFVACSTESNSNEISTEPTIEEQPIKTSYESICVGKEDTKGPWENDLIKMSPNEGQSKEEGTTIVESAGVPSLIQNQDGRLILAFEWFDCSDEKNFDKPAVSFSEDGGETWSSPEAVEIDGLPEGYQRPFDPTLALLEDGRIRMYFTSSETPTPKDKKDVNIYSAVSEDGLHYSFEEGIRFDLGEMAYDSAVGYWDELWHLITPKNENGIQGKANHGISEDGLDFELQDPIELPEDVSWTGNFFANEKGLYFYGTLSGQPEEEHNWFTVTRDGETWTNPEKIESFTLGDPAYLCLEQDECLVIGVSKPQ